MDGPSIIKEFHYSRDELYHFRATYGMIFWYVQAKYMDTIFWIVLTRHEHDDYIAPCLES